MRISDWSSDVCSSDLLLTGQVETDASGEQVVALRFLNRTDRQEILALPDRIEAKVRQENRERTLLLARANDTEPHLAIDAHGFGQAHYRLPANETLVRAMEIGRASCRERMGQYV